MKRVSLVTLGLTCLLGCASCDIHQPLRPSIQTYGAIEGTVSRTDGRTAAGTAVVLTKTVQIGWSWGPTYPPYTKTIATLEADDEGNFSLQHIPIGSYKIHAEGDEDYYVDPPRRILVITDQVTSVSLTLHRWHQDIEFDVEDVQNGQDSFVRVHAAFMNDSADSVTVEKDCPRGHWFTVHSETMGAVRVQDPLESCPSDLVIVEPGGSIESSLDLRLKYPRGGDPLPLPPGEYEVQAGVGFFEGPSTQYTHRYRARSIAVEVR